MKPKAAELCLVVTQFFGTIFAGKTFVGVFCKTFGMFVQCPFPLKKNDQTNNNKAPSIPSVSKNKGSKHHCKVPVVNTAGGATSVFHKPGLKRAEE